MPYISQSFHMFRSPQPSSHMLLLLNVSSPVLLGKGNYKHKKTGYMRGNLPEIKKISCPGGSSDTVATVRSTHCNKTLFNEEDVVGILGGVSLSSTLTFLEKLVHWSARDSEAGQHLPFVLCNDPGLSKEILCDNVASLGSVENGAMVENLRHKMAFLEQAGARCVVMPCHVSHGWYVEICKGCSAPFLHVGECVAREIKEANLKPIEAGSSCVRIGVIASDGILSTGIYQENLQSQGFEVVLPDKGTMEHILVPAIGALRRGDIEGARILFRIAIQALLIRAVSAVIIASDDLQCLLPDDDPLLKKCIDPMEALARSTIKWATSAQKCMAKAE